MDNKLESARIQEELEVKLIKMQNNAVFKEYYPKILKSCFQNLIEEEPQFKILNQLQSIENINEEELNEAFNLLMLMISELLRKNFVESEIQFSLQEAGFDENFIKAFQPEYKKVLEFIRNKDNEGVAEMFDSSISFQKLVDVEWKQDFVVATKYITHLNRDVFYIDLNTLENEQIKNVSFRCSLQQLTELVQKLNVALKTIENAKI